MWNSDLTASLRKNFGVRPFVVIPIKNPIYNFKRIVIHSMSLMFAAFLVSYPVISQEMFILSDKNEIQDAHQLNILVEKIPPKVLFCLDSLEGPDIGDCECIDQRNCASPTDFQAMVSYFCELRQKYPSWVNNAPNYSLETDKRGFVLSMFQFEERLGRACV